LAPLACLGRLFYQTTLASAALPCLPPQMTGEFDLDTLLRDMQPVLHPKTFVYCTMPSLPDLQGIQPKLIFAEAEGMTLIVTRDQAAQLGLAGDFPCRMITLNVHSALEAVGFIAKIANTLAALGMGVNPVAGYYHDHLFIPADRADDAMAALLALVEDTSAPH